VHHLADTVHHLADTVHHLADTEQHLAGTEHHLAGTVLTRRAVLATAAGLATAGLGAALPIGLAAEASAATSRWMSAVPGSRLLSQLVLPGTHDSCARSGGSLVACQTRTLAEQLNAGIRFLDIRCRHISDVFAIHHGPVFQNLYFGDGVRDVCLDFLTANPSECIVMSVKEEHTSADITRTFEDTFDSYTQGQTDRWHLESAVPTLDDVRGRIVLFRRFSAARTPKGLDLHNWPDNTTFDLTAPTPISVQDRYEVPTLLPGDISAKWNAVSALLDRAGADPTDRWFVNFASGASVGAYPDAVAAQINPKLSTALAGVFAQRVGTVLMDFPTDALISRLIELNA
jgi:1-phosphatidylinositol phosphodiesterase